MNICVIGLGYIGLPTALLLSKNYEVFGYDIKEEVVNKINNKIAPFIESGINDLLDGSNIIAHNKPTKSDVYVICVPTPYDPYLKSANLSYLKKAITDIIPLLDKENLIIIESTIPPGTSEKLVIPMVEKRGLIVGKDVYLCHCPERAIPGNTINEMINNHRIIGGINNESSNKAENIYKSYVKGTIYKTNLKTAEFIKLIENAFRDVNIAYANELALISKEIGINVWEAIELANKHPRVNILKPGPGVGGHCIAVDPLFLVDTSVNAHLINQARQINDSMPLHVIKQIISDNIAKKVEPLEVTIFGVSYKGDVDDTRETPILKLIHLGIKEGWTIRLYDPYVKEFEFPISSFEESIKGSDLLIIGVDHSIFKNLKPEQLSSMRVKRVYDTRNILDARKFVEAGFDLRVLGS